LLIGDDEAARSDCDMALELDRENPTARLVRAALLERAGAYSAALMDLKVARWEGADDQAVSTAIARCLVARHDYAPAILELDGSLQVAPKSKDLHLLRGLAHDGLGDWDASLADYGSALRLDEDYGDARLGQARALAMLGRLEKAKAVYEHGALRHPDDERFAQGALRCKEALQRVDAARGSGKARFAAFESTAALGHYNEGVAMRLRGENEKAIDEFSRAVALEPKRVESYLNRAACHESVGRVAPALMDYTKAVELGDPSGLASYNRGRLHLALGNLASALGDLTAALRRNPQLVEAYRARSRVYSRMGNLRQSQADEAMANRLGN
jgi:tetratricopeptide (TPR) repeat protein